VVSTSLTICPRYLPRPRPSRPGLGPSLFLLADMWFPRRFFLVLLGWFPFPRGKSSIWNGAFARVEPVLCTSVLNLFCPYRFQALRTICLRVAFELRVGELRLALIVRADRVWAGGFLNACYRCMEPSPPTSVEFCRVWAPTPRFCASSRSPPFRCWYDPCSLIRQPTK